MPSFTGGNLGLAWGFVPHEDGWADSYNLNFQKLDALVHLAVISVLSTPPGAPAAEDRYIVGPTATGAWATHETEIAIFTKKEDPDSRAWVFLLPTEGYRAWNVDTATWFQFDGAAWNEDAASTLPAPGTDGQVLTLVTGAPAWADTAEELPAPGTDGQVLTLVTGAPAWADSTFSTIIFIDGGAWDGYAAYDPYNIVTFDSKYWVNNIAIDSAGALNPNFYDSRATIASGSTSLINFPGGTVLSVGDILYMVIHIPGAGATVSSMSINQGAVTWTNRYTNTGVEVWWGRVTTAYTGAFTVTANLSANVSSTISGTILKDINDPLDPFDVVSPTNAASNTATVDTTNDYDSVILVGFNTSSGVPGNASGWDFLSSVNFFNISSQTLNKLDVSAPQVGVTATMTGATRILWDAVRGAVSNDEPGVDPNWIPTGETVAGSGAVFGPASVTDDLPAVFDGTTGKLIKQKTYAAFKTLLALVKGDVGLGNVDNTADTAKPVSTAQQTALDLKAPLASPALTGTPTAPTAAPGTNSTQLATTAYADAAATAVIAAADAMVFKGVIDCSTNPNYPAADRGHTYRVSVAGKIGGASGPNVEAGDILLCLTDGTASGTHAAVGANWSIIQVNLDGAVIGPASAVDSRIAAFDGTTGKLLKDGGILTNTIIVSGGALGTPSSGVATNLTGTASGLTAGTVTTNANLTGPVTSVGNATAIANLAVTNAMLAGSIAASKLVGTDIATLGTVTTGTWNAGVVAGQYGGTGVTNTGKTITLGGNLVTSGAFATTLTVAATTNSTLPPGTHTLAGLDVIQTWSANQSFNSGNFLLNGSTSGTLTVKPAAVAGSNTLTFPAGTTDFSATGATGAFVKQASAGAALTVAVPTIAEIAGLGIGVATALADDTRTNFFPNNSMQGAVAGSPGTRPTSWATFTLAGLTQTIVGIGVENGADYIDVRFNGTSTAATIIINFHTGLTIAGVQNQVWTMSAFLSLVGGTLTNVNTTRISIDEYDSGGAFLTNHLSTIGPPTSTQTRYSSAITMTNASCAFIAPSLRFAITNGAAIDFTIRIAWPQIELGATVTAAIRTVNASVTRLADFVRQTSPPTHQQSVISENIKLTGNVIALTAGKGLQLQSGTGARAGDATLVAGTVTVTNTTVTANTKILLSRKTIGGTVGNLSYTLSAGASFTINSSSGTDTSTITYMLVELN